MERLNSGGLTPLLSAAYNAPNGGKETVQTLLDAKASLHFLHRGGADALLMAAINENNTTGLLMMLVGAGANVNLRQTPQARAGILIQRFARWAVEHGAKSGFLQEVAAWGGVTPLMGAAGHGKVEEVRQLLDMAADPAIRNYQGLTALELTRNKFGWHVPLQIQQLLDPA